MKIQRRYKVSGHLRAGVSIFAFTRIVRASSPERAEEAVRKHISREPAYFGKDLEFIDVKVQSW